MKGIVVSCCNTWVLEAHLDYHAAELGKFLAQIDPKMVPVSNGKPTASAALPT